jgi:transcriptional regulator with XRE-family HTH domain
MSSYRLALSLLPLGWSERELARRTGEHRNTIRRWLAGESAVDAHVAAWLDVLVAVHLANPAPRRPRSFIPESPSPRPAKHAQPVPPGRG